MSRKGAGRVIAAWTQSGTLAGLAIGGGFGALVGLFFGLAGGLIGLLIGLLFGLVVGALVGLFAGLAVGLLDGLLLALLRPARRHAPLAAVICTELILLPAQTLLVLQSAVFLPVVAVPSVASFCVAAELGRRLPPGGGQPPA